MSDQVKNAIVTGAGSGIGRAIALLLAENGTSVVVNDLDEGHADAVVDEIRSAGGTAVASVGDVTDAAWIASSIEQANALAPLKIAVNNAGIQPGSSIFGEQSEWDAVLSINLGGVINGTRVFGPAMMAHGQPALIINTGSKQGITTPPGDPAYNVSKAGVKVFTEALQHELRNRPDNRVEAALLIPGFVWTDLTRRDRTEKPAGAWTPEETVDFMLERLEAGDFYILCPDNETTREMDEKRIRWAADDVASNRPPLSRWEPSWAPRFKTYLDGE